MLSLLKKGPSANKVPAEKIQATYGRYRMQALLSVFLGYLAYYIVRNNFTLSTPYLKEQLLLSGLLRRDNQHLTRIDFVGMGQHRFIGFKNALILIGRAIHRF